MYSSCNLSKHLQTFSFQCSDIRFYFPERSRWLIRVEVAIEIDLVADFPNSLVFLVTNRSIDPGIRNVWYHLTLEKGLDIFLEWNIFSITELRIRFRVTVFVIADISSVITFRQGREDRFAERGR